MIVITLPYYTFGMILFISLQLLANLPVVYLHGCYHLVFKTDFFVIECGPIFPQVPFYAIIIFYFN